MNPNSLVSITIPVFNGSNYLTEAIDSALAQTYANIEVLVVNDGSNDGGATREIALRYGGRIRYLEKENGGVSSALNLAIREMKGDWFSWLSHDDLFLPEKTRKQVEFLSKIRADIVYGDYQFIDEKGAALERNSDVVSLSEKGNLFCQMLSGYPVNGCTTLISRKVFDRIGYFNTDLPTTQDYDFWFRCAKEFEFHLLPEVVIKSRIHKDQDTNKRPLRQYECDELYTRIARYIAEDEKHRGISQEQLYSCARFLLKYNYLSALFMIQRGLRPGLRVRIFRRLVNKVVLGL
ncbi:MAG: glycosyltransferase [Bacteroidales bacterium]